MTFEHGNNRLVFGTDPNADGTRTSDKGVDALPWMRMILRKLDLVRRYRLTMVVEDDEAGARCPLVDGADECLAIVAHRASETTGLCRC